MKELSAAVAFACGRGFVDLGTEPSPAVAAFLQKKIDRISCDDIPSNAPASPPNFTQALYRYMTLSAGLTWRLLGISWMNLAVLLGLLYAVSAVAVYGVFRLAMNRASAAAGALILTVSPLQLRFLPELRDYAKAPFILTLILMLGLLVARPFTPRRLLALAMGYGAIMGIGFGFRNDLLINVLPFIVTVALFLPIPYPVAPQDEAGGTGSVCRDVRRLRMADHHRLSIGQQHGTRRIPGFDDAFQHAARSHRVGLRLGRTL